MRKKNLYWNWLNVKIRQKRAMKNHGTKRKKTRIIFVMYVIFKRRIGMLVTFEGIDGVGKSTQAELFVDYLERGRLCKAVLTREPGGTEAGTLIRAILERYPDLDKTAGLMLFLADRAQHAAELIRPALRKGKIVVSDRYMDSTTAYQLSRVERSPELFDLASKFRFLTNYPAPDVTFLLDMPVEDVRNNDMKNLTYRKRVRHNYMEIAELECKRVKVIDACGTVNEVHARIVSIFEQTDAFYKKFKDRNRNRNRMRDID
jgi:dTMP kinase